MSDESALMDEAPSFSREARGEAVPTFVMTDSSLPFSSVQSEQENQPPPSSLSHAKSNVEMGAFSIPKDIMTLTSNVSSLSLKSLLLASTDNSTVAGTTTIATAATNSNIVHNDEDTSMHLMPEFRPVTPPTGEDEEGGGGEDDDATMVEGEISVGTQPTAAPTVVPCNPIPLRQHLELDQEDDDVSSRPVFPTVVGHRGSLYEYLENTLPGILSCIGHGCDEVEFDVYRLKDDTLIVFHAGGTNQDPGDLSNYCVNTVGQNILSYTYPEALLLEFNTEHKEFGCPTHRIREAKIPTLREVLTALQNETIRIKIELKHEGTEEPVLLMVEEMNMLDRVSFSSFQHDRIVTVRQLRPDKTKYRTAALYNREVPEDFIADCIRMGATEIHMKYDWCSRSRIRAVHAAGFRSMAWIRGPIGMNEDITTKYNDIGNEDEACYQAVIDTGVQQICGNRPTLLIKMRNAALAKAAARQCSSLTSTTVTDTESDGDEEDEDDKVSVLSMSSS